MRGSQAGGLRRPARQPDPVDGEWPLPTSGEVWAREQLALLSEGRFQPGCDGAVCKRVVASQRRRPGRAAAARGSCAELDGGRRRGVAGAGGCGSAAVPPAAGWRPRVLGVTSLMLDWHLGMFETADGRPCQLGAADALTLARAWLVPVVADSPTLLVCAVAA